VCRSVTSWVSALSGFGANGHQTLHHVSSSPSKIPYGGFSPVRLQTELPRRDLRRRAHPGGLYAASRSDVLPLWPSRASGLAAVSGVSARNISVQRPLAHQPVMLSGRVIAYYGLIRASGRHRLAYWSSSSRPLERPEGPNFYLPVRDSVPPALPRRTGRWVGCSRPARGSLRLHLTGSASAIQASRFTPGSVTGLHSSLNAAARNLARPAPTRAFTFELSSHESPHWNVEHNYAGKQPIPAVGLTPTGPAALLAATDERRWKIVTS